jgi:hypothetical protein
MLEELENESINHETLPDENEEEAKTDKIFYLEQTLTVDLVTHKNIPEDSIHKNIKGHNKTKLSSHFEAKQFYE